MSWRQKKPFRWLDGLRGRIAATLLITLVVQFVGGELIFRHLEQAQWEQGNAQRLADWLSFADEFAAAQPDAIERMTALWQPDLIINRTDRPTAEHPHHPADRAEEEKIEQLVIAARPNLAPLAFHAHRNGADLTGTMQLSNGSWLSYQANNYFNKGTQWIHYAMALLIMLGCTTLLAYLFARMIGRPLQQIVEAADSVGRDRKVEISVTGPYEVRQVAGAFERLQSRLFRHVQDRIQSMAAMSHDLRTPLARMRLNSSSIKENDTRIMLEQDVEEMDLFVSSVLDYLRGEETEEQQPTDVASIIMTVVDEALDRDEQAEYSGPHRLEAITRPLQLKRIVRNIIQNAIRHGGNAFVVLEQDQDNIIITISDDGPGISERDMELVLEPFRRLETSRNKQTGGFGLGLAIARRFADTMGGSVTLSNRSPHGLEVVIRLPYHAI